MIFKLKNSLNKMGNVTFTNPQLSKLVGNVLGVHWVAEHTTIPGPHKPKDCPPILKKIRDLGPISDENSELLDKYLEELAVANGLRGGEKVTTIPVDIETWIKARAYPYAKVENGVVHLPKWAYVGQL